MPWLAHHNSEIDWRTGEVKMTRCPEECRKQWRPKQRKSEQQKQKKEKRKKEAGKKQEEREAKQEREEKKPKKERRMEVRRVIEEWKIWDGEEETVKSEEEAEKLVPEKFHKWIHVFGKKISKQILLRKPQDHVIDMKKRFVPRKGKVYLLSREERKEVCEFISEQLRKEYIRPLKLSQIAPVFFVGRKDSKKQIVQNYRYLNEGIVKNNYSLPLISDIIENISIK